MISKRAEDPQKFRRRMTGFSNARTALKAYLLSLGISAGDGVLLPAYVGWSPREGSGVMDPIAALGLVPVFYAVDRELNIDLSDFRARIIESRPKAALLIHFFGRVDPRAEEASLIAHDHGVPVVEDAAHALYTMMVGGAAGHIGDATILSLHKMLPMCDGGALVLPPTSEWTGESADLHAFWEYDLAAIAARRMANACAVLELLGCLRGNVDPLWETWPAGHVPQTVPVLVRKCCRYEVYQRMNESGFGVVSLWHTLVRQISREDFPVSHELSAQILNIPVHQDVVTESLPELVHRLKEIVTRG